MRDTSLPWPFIPHYLLPQLLWVPPCSRCHLGVKLITPKAEYYLALQYPTWTSAQAVLLSNGSTTIYGDPLTLTSHQLPAS